MAEAAIMMPVFILLFASTVYVTQEYGNALAATELARRCAWQHASNGCPAERPTECANVQIEGGAASQEQQLDRLGQKYDFIGGPLQKLVGRDALAHEERHLEQPELLGGGTKTVKSRIAMTCNERPITDEAHVVDAAWGRMGI